MHKKPPVYILNNRVLQNENLHFICHSREAFPHENGEQESIENKELLNSASSTE